MDNEQKDGAKAIGEQERLALLRGVVATGHIRLEQEYFGATRWWLANRFALTPVVDSRGAPAQPAPAVTWPDDPPDDHKVIRDAWAGALIKAVSDFGKKCGVEQSGLDVSMCDLTNMLRRGTDGLAMNRHKGYRLRIQWSMGPERRPVAEGLWVESHDARVRSAIYMRSG